MVAITSKIVRGCFRGIWFCIEEDTEGEDCTIVAGPTERIGANKISEPFDSLRVSGDGWHYRFDMPVRSGMCICHEIRLPLLDFVLPCTMRILVRSGCQEMLLGRFLLVAELRHSLALV